MGLPHNSDDYLRALMDQFDTDHDDKVPLKYLLKILHFILLIHLCQEPALKVSGMHAKHLLA